MEKFTQKWAIVSLLEDTEEGSGFYYTDFPLHVTLAGVFATDKTGHELIQELSQLLTNRKCVEIEADEKAMFGPHKDVAVMKIQKTPDLMSLYSDIYSWLNTANVTYNSPEYQGEGYVPHSTFQKTACLELGERRLLKSVSLVDLFPDNDGCRRKIRATLYLQ